MMLSFLQRVQEVILLSTDGGALVELREVKKELEKKKRFKLRPKKNKKNRLEGNVAVFEDLGIHNSDPEKDKKINDELKSFLKSIGCKPARIKIKNE